MFKKNYNFKRNEILSAYIFLAPWLIGFIIFLEGHMLGGIVLSFFEWNGISNLNYIGLYNYITALNDPDFWKSLFVTITFVFTALPLRVIIALALALLVVRIKKFQNVISSIIYIPAVIPGVALALLFAQILNPHAGMINEFLYYFGIEGPEWLFSEEWALPSLVIMFIWQSGAAMILYIIGLATIPKELLEAATIDGAGPWRKLISIKIPLLTPIILFNLIVGVIKNFQYFDLVFVLSQGGPNKATLFFVFNIYITAFEYFELGYASALAVILSILIGILTYVLLKSSKNWVFYQS